MRDKLLHVVQETRQHLPYTVFSTALGLILMGMLTFIAELISEPEFPRAASGLFHVFHPVHMLMSAGATTTMFWSHERRIVRAVVIGFVGSIGICSLSDIFIPFVSGLLLDVEMEFHICILEHPERILPFVIIGIAAGLIAADVMERSTVFSHSSHVLVSSMASILYLISFGLHRWIESLGILFIYMIVAVLIPCCVSDVVFPLFFVSPEQEFSTKEEKSGHYTHKRQI